MPEGRRISQEVHRVFFARFGGRLRQVQELAFDLLVEDRDGLVMAQTGSGKTEAILVPVAERLRARTAADRGRPGALVISPTRALASDLHRRTSSLFAEINLRMDVATSDRHTLCKTPPDVLIKTPEGLDVELCRRPDWLSGVHDVVIDELHKFLDDPRGTQLSGLLARLAIHAPRHRRLAISATIPDLTAPVGSGILRDPVLVEDPDSNGSIELIYHEWLGRTEEAADRLVAALRERNIRKAIGFVGRRDRAETLAHLLSRGFLKDKTYPHHADLSSANRRKVEDQLRHRPVALVVATTMLEVGIDIGNIDACILFDAPPDRNSFFQRAGRSGRRSGQRRVICVPGLYNRRIDFARVVQQPLLIARSDHRPYLSGCLQQILSYVVQGNGQSVEWIAAMCSSAFGSDRDTVNMLLTLLARDDLIDLENGNALVTENLAGLRRTMTLHKTFAGSGGTLIVDEVTGRHLGRAAVVGETEVLLGGKGRRVKRIDTNTGAAIINTTEKGKASFSPRGKSFFERLATKYHPMTGGRFRLTD